MWRKLTPPDIRDRVSSSEILMAPFGFSLTHPQCVKDYPRPQRTEKPTSGVRVRPVGSCWQSGWLRMAVAWVCFFACLKVGAQTPAQFTILAPQGGTTTPLVQASDGNFYFGYILGSDNPALMKMTPSGTVTTIYSFAPSGAFGEITSLIQGSDGNFYLTVLAQANSNDIIAKVTPAGVESVVYSIPNNFTYPDSSGIKSLIQGSDGNFYGVLSNPKLTITENPYSSSIADYGEVFQLTPSGTFTVLHALTTAASGGLPASLVEGQPGIFYGATNSGGTQAYPNGYGTIFQVSSSGAFSTLYTFGNGADGDVPQQVIPAADGSLYGFTYGNATGGNPATVLGTFFHYSNGSLKTLYIFTPANGIEPSSLMLASDGNFYGTTKEGGSDGAVDGGTLFSLTPAGAVTLLYSFTGQQDGTGPLFALIQGSDGNFYGSTYSDQPYNTSPGSIFKLSLTPALNPPVQLTLSASSVNAGQSVTLNWSVNNATSATLQQCVATTNGPASDSGWTGLQKGTAKGNIYSGTATVTPSKDGDYTYALTCGGSETGFASLTAGAAAATTTTLTASANTITVGQPVTLTATVKDGNGPVGQGSVSFADNGKSLGAAVAVNAAGVATFPANSLPVGANSIVASYAGDTTDAASSSTASVITVNSLPSIAFAPTSLTFPIQNAGTSSSSLSLVLTNNGSVNLALGAISISGQNSSDFKQTNNCPTGNLAPGATCTVQVVYAPSLTASGAELAVLQVADNAASNPQQIPLNGTAKPIPTAPVASVSPTSLTFASTVSGSTSPSQTVVVTNTGNAPLVLPNPSATITGPNQADFSAVSSACDGQSVAANANCSITVTFHPSASAGSEAATLQIMNNAAGSPQLVQLTGIALPPPSVSCTVPSINITGPGITTYSIPCTATSVTAPVSFVCNLPASLSQYFSCSFSPASINFAESSTGSTTLTLTIPPATTAKLRAPRRPGGRGGASVLWAFAFWPFLLPLAGTARKRRRATLALALIAMFGLLASNGCGGSGPKLPPAGSYQGTIAVSGTDVSASIPFTIVVK